MISRHSKGGLPLESTMLRSPLLFLFVAVGLLTTSSQPTAGQNAALTFSHLQQKDGLTSNSVTAIAQDDRGFMWIATSDGLNRFNGYTVTTWRAVPDDTLSLTSNSVTALCADGRNGMWIGTIGGGVCRYNASRGTFSRIEAGNGITMDRRVQSLFLDSQGVLWIGTFDGLYTYHEATNTWARFRHDPTDATSISNNSVSAIAEDANGIVWIGTRSGLNAFNRATGSFKRYAHAPVNPVSLSEDYISALCVDSDGIVWIGTLSGVLNRFDPSSNHFQHYPLAVSAPSSLLADTRITSIAEYSGGRLLVGIQGNGLVLLSRSEPESRVRAVTQSGVAQSLASNDVSCLTIDAEGLLWIGTSAAGVSTTYSKVRQFVTTRVATGQSGSMYGGSVTCFAEAADGSIFVGLFGAGLYVVPRGSDRPQHIPIPGLPDGKADIQALLVDGDGHVWIGTYTGLYLYDPGMRLFTPFVHDPSDPGSLSNNSITSLCRDRSGTIWIGTDGGGLNQYDPVRTRFVRFQNDPQNSGSLSSNQVRAIYEDRSRRLWIGTNDMGLALYDRTRGSFVSYPADPADSAALPGAQVRSILEDPKGRLWIGTNAGLCLFPRGSGRMYRFGKRDGLPGEIISGLLFGNDGNLWVTTTEGLARLVLNKSETAQAQRPFSRVVVYDASDGLQGSDFNQNSCFAASNGKLYIGGRNGFNSFRPSTIVEKTFRPSVAITEFLLFNRRVLPGDKTGALKVPIESTSEITLSYDQNVLSFEFVTLSFIAPDRNRFMYWLEGFDREPNYVDANKRFATYTNLAPGEYILVVRGANADGVWSEQDVRLRIIITPPWWQTGWAYAAYVLFIAATLFVFDRMQRRRVIRREREAAQIREAELRAEAAELQASAAEQQTRAIEAQARAAEAQAEASEARAKVLLAENQRKELELEKARELEKAYSALDESLRNLRQTQDQLIHAEKMASLGALTAGIAHEIRNPLNFITNFSNFSASLVSDVRETLKSALDAPVNSVADSILPDLDDLETNVLKINEHGRRAESIVKSMLMHSRGASGDRLPTDLNALLDEAVNLSFHGMKANGMLANVRIDKSFDPAVGEIPVIPQEISRVVLNILNNAFYAVNERAGRSGPDFEPLVAVSSQRDGGMVHLRLRDNGGGVPEELKARIFEPFFTTKPTGSGTGLGLSLSYDIIVKGHHGMLRLETEPGEGSEFIITLPTHL